MLLSKFDYEFPEELIAAYPLKERDASRMMVINRASQSIAHAHVLDFPSFLKKGDVVVINDSRVFPARLIGKKETGGYFEILLLKPVAAKLACPAYHGEAGALPNLSRASSAATWVCITNQTKTSKPGLRIKFGDELVGTIVFRDGDELVIEFNKPELIEGIGLPPVPPYILKARSRKQEAGSRNKRIMLHASCLMLRQREAGSRNDKERYQTVYARETGSAAAPTAGLHFTEKLLAKIKSAGAKVVPITLHVGLDTFSPVRVKNIKHHKIHGEEYLVPDETVKAIEQAKLNGGRVIAIGTTSVRALESSVVSRQSERSLVVNRQSSVFSATDDQQPTTDLFIYPGYKFNTVSAMLTNFHQPKSTLLMLVSAFAGRELIMKAYFDAITQKYRLFSYGDCMLIV